MKIIFIIILMLISEIILAFLFSLVAQIFYKKSQIDLKSILKVGATNLGGTEYRQLLGPGLIGQQYFVSLTINP